MTVKVVSRAGAIALGDPAAAAGAVLDASDPSLIATA